MRALQMAVATVGMAGMLQAETPKPELKIQVFIYNYAGVSSETLAQAERDAARIYQHAAIEIQWLDCPLAPKDADQFPACQVPPGPTRLALRILSQSMAERVRQADESFGFAMLPEDGSFATMANVFSYDAEQLVGKCTISHRTRLPSSARTPLRLVVMATINAVSPQTDKNTMCFSLPIRQYSFLGFDRDESIL